MNSLFLSVAEFRPALAGLSKVIRRRVTLPVLGCVRAWSNGSGQIELAGTDLDFSLVAAVAAPDQLHEASTLIPFNELNQIVKTCAPEDIVEVQIIDANSLVLKCPVSGQMVEHRIDTLPVDQFPDIPEFSDSPILLPETVRESIQAALECASADNTRLVLNGACLDVSRTEGHYVVGTDGRHLMASNSFKLPLTQSLIVPNNKFLGWKGFCNDGEWKLQVKPAVENQAGWFQITSDHWRFIGRPIEGDYPNWRVVMPDANACDTHVEFDADLLGVIAQTIQRLPCHSERYHTLGLEIKARSLRLMGRTREDVPWTKVEVPTRKISGEAVTIFVDRLQLLKALRFGLTRIGIADASSPLLLTNDGCRKMVLMPLRLEGAAPASVTAPTPSSGPLAPVAEIQQSFPPEEPANSDPPNCTTTHTMPTYEDAPPVTHAPNGTATHALTVPEVIRRVTAIDLDQGRSALSEPAEKPILEAALEHIETVKSGFRDGINSLSKISEMLKKSMREQRVTQREIQSVRQTLRSLQGMRI